MKIELAQIELTEILNKYGYDKKSFVLTYLADIICDLGKEHGISTVSKDGDLKIGSTGPSPDSLFAVMLMGIMEKVEELHDHYKAEGHPSGQISCIVECLCALALARKNSVHLDSDKLEDLMKGGSDEARKR